MKRLLNRILLVFGVLLPFTDWGQVIEKWDNYSVSPNLNAANLNSKKLFREKAKAKSLENNIAEFYLFKDGIQVKPVGQGDRDFFAAGCLCFKYNDTLLFSSGLGHSAGIGVGLKIYQDQFSSSLHVNSKNSQIYKLTLSDSSFVNDLTQQPVHQTLKLIQKPTSSSEIMIGEYNGTFREFYQKGMKSGRIYIRKYRVRLIFKCKITGIDNISN